MQGSIGNAAVVQLLRRAGHAWAGKRHRHGAGCGHGPTGQPAVQPAPSVQRSAVHDVLGTPGRPLDDSTRAEMEARLGADFSDVRVHMDAAAQASAAEVGARAYTSGSHVVIGRGGADAHTLAHELTHVIQQRQGPVAGTDNGAGLSISDPSDRFEREAEANARRAMAGTLPEARPAAPARPAGAHQVQRMEAPAALPNNLPDFLADFRAHLDAAGLGELFVDDYWTYIDNRGYDGARANHPRLLKEAEAEWNRAVGDRDRANAAEADRTRTRIANTRAGESWTWDMAGDITYANGTGPQHLSGDLEGQIRRGHVRVRTRGGPAEAVLNTRHHIHVDGGSNGAAVIFLLDDDFRVRPCVYDYSTGRTSDNKYHWAKGATYYDSNAPVPGLAASQERESRLGRG